MPRLLLFSVCSRVIQDSEDDNLTLVSLIEGIAGYYRPGEPQPTEMSIQTRWSAVSVWLGQPEDEGKQFEQRVVVISPTGEQMGAASATFQMNYRTGRVSVNGRSFPTSGEGEHIVRLSFREAKTTEWQILSEYPILVVYEERDTGIFD
ncbi:MAG: hypothetical protein M3Y28_00155 [Armatimonadota bacterium]|nr:hypothetical protein [Armatimonadota bacterium]